MGHSTGGLIWTDFLLRYPLFQPKTVVLNSPFFELNMPKWKAAILKPIVRLIGRYFPKSRYRFSPTKYGISLHQDYDGLWSFNTKWKRLRGRAVHIGWMRALVTSFDRIKEGQLRNPVLVLASDKFNDGVKKSDIVLDPEKIYNESVRLFPDLKYHTVNDAMHDVFLSEYDARQIAMSHLESFYREYRLGRGTALRYIA